MSPSPARRAPRRKGRLRDLIRLCEERGVALSDARRAVLETLLAMEVHPTADEVFAAAMAREPGLGRATVYRALDALTATGIVTKALHPGAAVRYDIRAEPHHHLVCTRCEAIIDFTDTHLDALPVPDTSKLGFEVSDLQVQLRGICQDCLKKEERS